MPRNRKSVILVLGGVLLGLTATMVSAGARDAAGPRKERGGARNSCGAELRIVRPGGQEQVHHRASDFFQNMPLVEIDQGEKARPAIRIETLLSEVGADWLTVMDCGGQSQSFPSGFPFEGPVYLVITGRGSVKLVREIRPGRFVNMTQSVQALQFHARDSQRNSPPVPAKK